MDIIEIIKSIIAPLLTILPALAILSKIKEFFDLYEKSPWNKRNQIKKALENPHLSNAEKLSYGRTLTQFDFKAVYKFSPPTRYISKMIKIEQKSNYSITINDFSLANIYIDFEDDKIQVHDRPIWYKVKLEYNFWLSFLTIMACIVAIIYFILIFTNNYTLQHYHFNEDIQLVDFIFASLIPVYLIGAFIMRDEARAIRSLLKILNFGKSNPTLVHLKPSRLP